MDVRVKSGEALQAAFVKQLGTQKMNSALQPDVRDSS